MKYIKLFKSNAQGTLKVDSFAELPEFKDVFEEVIVTNFFKISKDLLRNLGLQYIKGAKITISTPAKKFLKTYELRRTAVKPFYIYKSITLDINELPRSIVEFKNGALYDQICRGYINFNDLNEYSQTRIEKCKKLNTLTDRDYRILEHFYKQLLKDCMSANITVFSPNQKTYYEAKAEMDFDAICAEHYNAKPLTEEEHALLEKFGPAYGITVRPFYYRTASRKTRNGYTAEPQEVLRPINANDYALLFPGKHKVGADFEEDFFDKNGKLHTRTTQSLPYDVKQGYITKECHSNLNDREAFNSLMWFMKFMPDDGLMPEYHRCPTCGKIYHEVDGCPGHVDPIIQIRADNLFYGIESTFEDYEATDSAYDSLELEEEIE